MSTRRPIALKNNLPATKPRRPRTPRPSAPPASARDVGAKAKALARARANVLRALTTRGDVTEAHRRAMALLENAKSALDKRLRESGPDGPGAVAAALAFGQRTINARAMEWLLGEAEGAVATARAGEEAALETLLAAAATGTPA